MQEEMRRRTRDAPKVPEKEAWYTSLCFDGARNWASPGIIYYFEVFFRRLAASSNKTVQATARAGTVWKVCFNLNFSNHLEVQKAWLLLTSPL
jgi:hypothetical protein